jgi:hypothetical protein
MKIEVRKPTQEELENLKVKEWSPWDCEVSEFDWEYQEDERCYILEGKVIVTTAEGDRVEIQQGDLVLFPKGLKCHWKVVQPIRKVYRFE